MYYRRSTGKQLVIFQYIHLIYPQTGVEKCTSSIVKYPSAISTAVMFCSNCNALFQVPHPYLQEPYVTRWLVNMHVAQTLEFMARQNWWY